MNNSMWSDFVFNIDLKISTKIQTDDEVLYQPSRPEMEVEKIETNRGAMIQNNLFWSILI